MKTLKSVLFTSGFSPSWKKLCANFYVFCLISSSLFSQTAPTPQNLPFEVNFGTSSFSSLPAGVAVWNGLNGDNISSQSSAEGSAPTGNATITSRTSTTTTGGAYGYATGGDAKLYIQTSINNTNGVNQPVVAINTTGASNISFSYTVDVISAQARTVGVVAQYRVGTSGAWTSITATSGSNPFSQANGTTGLKTTVTASLPSAANNQPVVQIRWAIWRGTETGSSSGIAIDNISVAAPSAPTISIAGAVTSFNTFAGTASAAQSFTATGTNLTAAIAVSAPEGFEVSTDNQATYASSTNISQSGGVASNTVFVRLAATNTPGNYSGNISLASTGAATNNVAVSGTVQAAGQVPVITATNFSGTVGVLFSNGITASGLPTSYAVATGTLPGGLILNATSGAITGTPNEAVTNRIVSVTASNATGTSAPADLTFTIGKGTQTITNFTGLADRILGSGSFNLAAGASSGLAVTYASSNLAVATVSSNTVTLAGLGTTVLTATQAGDANWNPVSFSQTLKVIRPPIAAWDFNGENSPTNSLVDVLDSNLDSSANLTRGSNAAPNSANNSFRTQGFQNDGISVTNTDYFEFQLSAKAGYSMSLSSIDARFDGTSTFYAAPGVTMQFAYSTNGTAFTLLGSPLVTTNTGSISAVDLSGVSALQNLAPATTVTFRYYASGQTTSGGWGFQSPVAGQYGLSVAGTFEGAPVITSSLTASATEGQAFSYTITSSGGAATYTASPLPSGLSLSGAVISGTPSVAGTNNITLTATNAGGSDSKTLVLTVNSAGSSQTQTITFNALTNRTYGDAAFALTANASSGLPVSYTSSDTNVAVVTNDTVTIRGAGATTLTASQAGNSTYLPATSVFQNLTVTRKTLSVTGLGASNKVYDGSPTITLTGTASLEDFVIGDTVTVSGGAGTTSDASVGTNRPVTVSGLTLAGAAAGNYTLQNPTGVTVTITPRPLTVRANAAGKIVGEVDPVLTYSVSGLKETNGISGALSRAAGTNSGVYTIQQGTLTASANYTLTYLSNSFTITQPYLPPSSYYSNAVGKSGTNLKTALNTIIKANFVSIPYGIGSSTGTNGIVPVMKLLFEDQANTNNLVLIYGGESVPKSSWDTVWNREHTWPQSFGTSNGFANSDLFHMYPCRGTVNSDRNDCVYGYVTNNTGAKTAPACRELEQVIWEPPDNEKGQIARGILYMAVRYEGNGDNGTSNLELIDGASDLTKTNWQFGQLTDLLAWNRNFPPTEKERWKNNEIHTKYQLNRNPFIDNPDYAEMVFRGTPSVAVSLGQNAAESGLAAGKITLKRLGSTSNSLTVNFTWGGSATPGTDTQSLSSSATFAAGADTVEVTVPPLADTEIEATEVLTLTLASSANYVSSQNSATMQIADAPVASGKTQQTLSFPAFTATPVYGDAPLTLAASASSGLSVSYLSANTNVATVSGNVLTITGAGVVTITASQAGNTTFDPAVSVERVLTVEPKPVTIAGATASSKVYDRTVAAVVNGSLSLSEVLAGDSVSLGSAAAVFGNKDVGTNKVVTTGYTLSGPDADHYRVVQPSGLTASINPAGLSVTGATVSNKAYDGTTTANLTGGTLVGVLGDAEATDDVSLAANPTGTFASKEVGTWSVTANLGLTGVDAGNYLLNQPTGLTGTISAGQPYRDGQAATGWLRPTLRRVRIRMGMDGAILKSTPLV